QLIATVRACNGLRDFAVRVVQITEHDRSRRTRLGAGCREITVLDIAALQLSALLRVIDALNAEGALLHNTTAAHRDEWVELFLQSVGPLGLPKVEEA